VIKGSCLCGKIAFQADEISNKIYNCHCSRCRKSSGSAFATQVFANLDSLNFIKGRDALVEYESTGGIRTFCSACGSRLMNYGKPGVDYLSIAISAIDNPNGLKPSADCFTENKLPWCTLDNTISHHETMPQACKSAVIIR